MARNVEIKATIPDLATIRANAAALASGPMEIIDQTDTFFVVPQGRLKVRAYSDGSGELISYERADEQGPKESVYTRVACEDARVLLQALSSVLSVRGIVAKRREVFLIGRTRVHLDRVEDLGCFVELEVVLAQGEPVDHGHREAHNLLRSLEIPEGALVAGAYIDLLEKAVQSPAAPVGRLDSSRPRVSRNVRPVSGIEGTSPSGGGEDLTMRRSGRHPYPILGLALTLMGSIVVLRAQAPRFDLVIKNARVIDGTGSPWFRSDIGIRGDAIVAIARGIDTPATRTIDAANQVVAPGFVDVHVHAFGGVGPPSPVLPVVEVPTADNYVRQGVTTLITGPDGFSPVPLGPALELAEKTGITPNLGAFIGHGSIRAAVFGSVNRAPTASELERMRTLTRDGMRDGAFGLSTGLFYVPATFSKTDEIVELAKVAGAMGGVHISHMRDEELGVEASVRETIAIGELGGLPTQVTHHKVIGKASWGKSVDTLRLIDEARQRGVDVTLDVYPYPASSTNISAALMPGWAQEGTRDDILKRLRDPVMRGRIARDTVRIILEGRGGGDAHNVMLSRCDWNPSLAGQRLDDVAAGRGKSRSVEDAADTAFWLVENGDCGGIYFAIGEEDIQRVLRHPASMIASDGQVVLFGRASPHPRSYGTFVRVLGRYVRDLKVLTLEDAIRKMSSYPAQRIGLTDRGVLREGMKADLVMFDPATVRDMATFEQPHQYPQGISVVMINGQVAFENGAMTAARSGRMLYGPARTP